MYVPFVVIITLSFHHSWLITGGLTSIIRWVSLVFHRLLTHLEHLSSPPLLEVFVVNNIWLSVNCFVDHCFFFLLSIITLCCLVCPSNYGFLFPLWYLQTFLAGSPKEPHLLGVVFDQCRIILLYLVPPLLHVAIKTPIHPETTF